MTFIKTILNAFTATIILTGMTISGLGLPSKTISSDQNTQKGSKPTRPFGKLPLVFEENQGQADKSVRFLGRGPGYNFLLTDTGATFSLRRAGAKPAALKMSLAGADPSPNVLGIDLLAAQTNYYTGRDPKGWHQGVSNYAKVKYEGIYDGIDMVYYTSGNDLEYDFNLAPNADPGRIKIKFEGAENIALDEKGNLKILAAGELFEQRAPVSYQEIDGSRRMVESRFVISDSNAVGFSLGQYDRSRSLTIDPVMRYLTYIGGDNGNDNARKVAVDSQQNAYLVGVTGSTDFTPDNTPRGSDTGSAVFVAKLNANGTQLLFLSILDGEEDEAGADIALDDFGNSYIVGQTKSEQFPVHNAYQPEAVPCLRVNNCYLRDLDAFVAKFNGSGQLANSTYLGGRDWDDGTGIAVNSTGSLAYITGTTESSTFPTVDEYQGGGLSGNGGDAFLTVMPMNGGSPIYSTHFGGDQAEQGTDVEIDAAGNAYITGSTDSTDMPVKSAFQTVNKGGVDSFVAKFNPFLSGSASLTYATYLGGVGGDYAKGIAVTPQGKAYVTGVTGSVNFPLLHAVDTTNQVNEVFITALNTNAMLFASTLLGGNGQDTGNSIMLDGGEVVYVTGSTTSTDFPRVLAFQNTRNGVQDAFVSKVRLRDSGSALVSSSYLGGSGSEGGTGVAVSGNKHIYVVGSTLSNDLPTSGGAVKSQVVEGSTNLQGFAAHILDTQRDTIGVYDPLTTEFQLRNTISPSGQANIISVDQGASGDIPVTADWNGDGIDTTGTFNNGVWRYLNLNVFSGYPTGTLTFNFGQAGDIPVAGDWNGDGLETPGVFRPSTQEFLLSDSLVNPQTDHAVKFGHSSDRPVIGDWDGDGFDSPGIYRPSDGRFRLTNALTGIPAPDNVFQLGAAEDRPVAGDWNADGLDDVGLWKPSSLTFSFDTNKTDGTDLPSLVFGSGGDVPVAGEWEGRPNP